MTDLSEDFQIRVAIIEDIEGIVGIDKELGSLHPNLDEKVKKLIYNDDGYFLVAIIEGKVVGYAGGIIRETEFGEGDPIGYITHVGLAKQLKSKGMGSMLGDKLLEKMTEKCDVFRTILKFERIDLQVFFNSIGFTRTDNLVYELKYEL